MHPSSAQKLHLSETSQVYAVCEIVCPSQNIHLRSNGGACREYRHSREPTKLLHTGISYHQSQTSLTTTELVSLAVSLDVNRSSSVQHLSVTAMNQDTGMGGTNADTSELSPGPKSCAPWMEMDFVGEPSHHGLCTRYCVLHTLNCILRTRSKSSCLVAQSG